MSRSGSARTYKLSKQYFRCLLIRMVDLKRLDLNLLVALDILLEERSVTRAASRLALSQPAASAALARLRAHLGDQLLVRSRGEMFLTERASSLRWPIKQALRALSDALNACETFDPAALDRKFRLAMTDSATLILGPRLRASIHAAAPRAALEFVALDRSKLGGWIRDGVIDGAVVVASKDEQSFEREFLFDDKLVFLTAVGHRLSTRRKLTLDQLANFPRIEVTFAAALMRPLLGKLEASGTPWPAILTLPNFHILPAILKGSDCIGIMGRVTARTFVAEGAATILDCAEVLPTVTCHLIWHKRLNCDPAHIWMRSMIGAAARSLGALEPSGSEDIAELQ